jgi:hypothetical protein
VRARSPVLPVRHAEFILDLRAPAGDDPPRDRTGELRALGFEGRRLGPVQMTTDTALGVTKAVVQDKGACARAIGASFPALISSRHLVPLAEIPYIVRRRADVLH